MRILLAPILLGACIAVAQTGYRWALGRRPLAVPPCFADSDLVVGFPDSNEVRTIAGSYTHHGRIIVVNRGTLLLDSADFNLRGDIIIANQGTMRARKGKFTVAQQFAYEFASGVTGTALLEFDSCLVQTGGYSWSAGVADSSGLVVQGCTLRRGFMTVALLGAARADYTASDFSSEFVVFDSTSVSIDRCDTTLIWLSFPDSSTADLMLPAGDTTIRHWEIHPGSPGVSGIRYRVTLDTVSGVMWGTFPFKGCGVTIRDSRLRTTGLIIPGRDSVHISGLANNQQHGDYTLPLADRTLRLVNTYLHTWNLYPSDSVRFVVESSIFGEMLASGAADVTVANSICDGSGGYIGTEGTGRLVFYLSMLNCQVVSRDRSIMFGAASTIRFGTVNATDASGLGLAFCQSEYEPRAHDTSVVYLADFAIPANATVGSAFPVTGTADIRPGPLNALRFASYRLSYAPPDSPAVWRPVGPAHTEPVNSDTLDIWDTRGLAPGTYNLKLTLKNSMGDSLEPAKGVYLTEASVAAPQLSHLPAQLALHEPRPNPFSRTTSVAIELPEPGLVDLSAFDIQGRKVATLLNGRQIAGTRHLYWAGTDESSRRLEPGVYVLRLETTSGQRTRKVVVAR